MSLVYNNCSHFYKLKKQMLMLDITQQETLELLFRVDGISIEDESSDASDIDSKDDAEI